MANITIHKKYNEFFEADVNGQIVRHGKLIMLKKFIKQMVNDTVTFTVVPLPKLSRADYKNLKATGMLWELYPTASGTYEEDKHLF